MNKKKITDIKLPRRKDDILLKAAFEELFPFLLRFYFPDADKLFDFRKGFVFLDKELSELFPELQKKGGSRFSPDGYRDACKSFSQGRKGRMDISAY